MSQQLSEKEVAQVRSNRAMDFAFSRGKEFRGDGKQSYFKGMQKDKPYVEFDERHLQAVGSKGRDKIREALDKADKREGVAFIDRGRAMKLERLRMAKEFADDVDAKKQKKYDGGSEPGVVEKIVDKVGSADKVVRLTVFGLSLVFVVLMIRFLFYPLTQM